MPTDRNRVRPELTEILNQDNKVFIGIPNPNKTSLVKYIYNNEKGATVCSAFRANGVKICTSTVIMPNGRCKFHGGKSLGGTAHPNFKSGRFSNSLPARLLERYEEGLNDETLTDFNDDLALINARLDDLFTQMNAGGGAVIFTEIADALQSFHFANQDGDKQAMRESLRRLDIAANEGKSENFIWGEISRLQEQRRKVILAQAKHQQLTNQTVTVTKVNILISALLDAVRQEVGDRNTLNRINMAFRQITNPNAPRQLTS